MYIRKYNNQYVRMCNTMNTNKLQSIRTYVRSVHHHQHKLKRVKDHIGH